MLDQLPSSRLKSKIGTVMADWHHTDGTVIRLELEPLFCVNCGKPGPYIPSTVVSATWLCLPCSQKHGEAAAGLFFPEEQFWMDVAHEMERRFGKALTQEEIALLADQGHLGKELDLLIRESPLK